jgi:hypothetical protein
MVGFFHADGAQVLRSPNAHVVIDDARRFMERSQDVFDIIVIDPPPPIAAAGSSLLYSIEFYQIARRRLRPGGVLQQWLPGGDPTVTSAIAQALQASFKDVRVFGSIEGWGNHFFASDWPIARLSAAELAARLPPAAVKDLLEWGPSADSASQFENILRRERNIRDLIRENPAAPPLTDDRPVNEYYMLRSVKGQ